MNKVKCFIDEHAICKLSATEKYAAISELIEKTSPFKHLTQTFKHDVIKREQEQSTGIGRGVAVAHGTCREISTISLALGLSRTGIPFNSIDGKPIYSLFLIATPPFTYDEYIAVLSHMVGKLRLQQIRESLFASVTTQETYNIIRNYFHFQ